MTEEERISVVAANVIAEMRTVYPDVMRAKSGGFQKTLRQHIKRAVREALTAQQIEQEETPRAKDAHGSGDGLPPQSGQPVSPICAVCGSTFADYEALLQHVNNSYRCRVVAVQEPPVSQPVVAEGSTPSVVAPGCPRAKSDMTPCYLRDGDLAVALAAVGWGAGQREVCVGCGYGIGLLKREGA